MLCAAKRREGVGTSVGEPPETLWSTLGKLAARLKYASIHKKHAAIENFFRVHNKNKDVRPRTCLPRAHLKASPRALAPRRSHHLAFPTEA